MHGHASCFLQPSNDLLRGFSLYSFIHQLIAHEAGIAYRNGLCQNRRFSSLPLYASDGIRTNDPSIIDKAILPSCVRVERCLSRPNRASRSGAKCKIVKSRVTCVTRAKKACDLHLHQRRNHHLQKTPMVAIGQPSLSRIRPLVLPAALAD